MQQAAWNAIVATVADVVHVVEGAVRVRVAAALVLVEASSSSARSLVVIKLTAFCGVAACYAKCFALVFRGPQVGGTRHGGRGGRGSRIGGRGAWQASATVERASVGRARARVLERPARELGHVCFGVAPVQVVVVFRNVDAAGCRSRASAVVVLVVAAARFYRWRAVYVVARTERVVKRTAVCCGTVCGIVVKLRVAAPPLAAAANLAVQRPVKVAAGRDGALKETSCWDFGAISFPPQIRRKQGRWCSFC